jgi:hypothetical protein
MAWYGKGYIFGGKAVSEWWHCKLQQASSLWIFQKQSSSKDPNLNFIFSIHHHPIILTLQAVPESISFISRVSLQWCSLFPTPADPEPEPESSSQKANQPKPSQNGFEVSFVNYHWQNVPVAKRRRDFCLRLRFAIELRLRLCRFLMS